MKRWCVCVAVLLMWATPLALWAQNSQSGSSAQRSPAAQTSTAAAAQSPIGTINLAEYEKRHDAANYFWQRGLNDARWFFDQTVFYEPRAFTFEDLWAEVEGQSRLLYPETGEILAV